MFILDSHTLLEPTLFLVAWVATLTTFFNSKTRWLRIAGILPLAFIAGRYLFWRLTQTINWEDGIEHTSVSLLMVACELMMFVVNTFSTWCLFTVQTNRSPQADRAEKLIVDGTFHPTVDVFIPTVNEPLLTLRRTVTGCQGMTYPNKKIFLLDDGRRPEVRALAEEMGVGYFDRDNNKHYKAGNVNNALWQTKSDFICFFDADFVPVPNFLNRVLGFFADENVALIQTPQSFYNPDLVQTNLGFQGNITNEQDMFFRSLQPGRDYFNAVICCGTSFVVRREPLEALGGMPTETITEDLMTSIYLQADGYEVVYLNECLSFGEAPNRSVDHLKQRVRWARGILQTLFTPVNPITCKGLNIWQRFYHLIGSLYWVTIIPRIMMLLMPLFFTLFSLLPIKATLAGITSFYLPYFISSLLVFSWCNHGRRSPFWSEVYELIPAFALIPNVLQTFVDPFGLGFKVTPKGVTTDKIMINWDVVIPCGVIITLYVYGLYYLLVNWSWSGNDTLNIVNFLWSAYAIAQLWMVCLASMDVPQKREALRFKQAWKSDLTVGNLRLTRESADISEFGVRIALTKAEAKQFNALNLTSGTLNIPEFGMIQTPVKGLRLQQNKGERGLSLVALWDELEQPQYELFIKHTFERLAAGWEADVMPEWKFIWNYIKTPLRMYPLAFAQPKKSN
jgi:cellulose synthase (UDP-forming)